MTSDKDRYLQFLAYCLDDSTMMPDITGMGWHGLYCFSQDQAIEGIILAGIDRLSKSVKVDVPQDLLLQWIGQVNIIETQNKLVNQRVKELTAYLKQIGKNNCILKGQGNAMMYSNPLRRTPGDIDVWLQGTKKEIVDFVHQQYPDVNVEYHHMLYPIFSDVEVEAHYYPSYCYNKWHNHRLQQFFREYSEEQFSNINTEGYAVPTVVFNLVFQLSHMMRHFFTQGIGLRHAIDYYYLLQQDLSDAEKQAAVTVMKRCGMYKFFCAVLWIEKEVLGLKKNTDIVTPLEKAGRMVLREMLKGGNFGHLNNRHHNNIIIEYAHEIIYRMKFILDFPSEPISRPFALVWDFARKRSGC